MLVLLDNLSSLWLSLPFIKKKKKKDVFFNLRVVQEGCWKGTGT